MHDFVSTALDKLPTYINYGDVRAVSEETEHIFVKNGNIEKIESTSTIGFGIKVLFNDGMGFSSCYGLDIASIDKVIKEAIEIARASCIVKRGPIILSEITPTKGEYSTKFSEDPFNVPIEEKLSLLLDADNLLRKEKVKISKSSLYFRKIRKVFGSKDGTIVSQFILISGGDISGIAIKENEIQTRSYGNWAQSGYEFVRKLDLVNNAQRVCEEANELLSAKPCPSGEKDLIIDTDQLWIQIHESIGHAVELDRVLGTEASYAGTSFVTIDKLDKFRYGSDIVNVVADATYPQGLGTFGWDDEGVPAQKIDIIRDGIFKGYLSSRETAKIIGRKSSGSMRASSWNRIPLIRMTNINLEPGEWELEDLIADTSDGLFIQTNKSWSIDDMRENFQFGVEYAREIKNGKLCDVVKDVTYTGYTPAFWSSCDAICNEKYWKLHGVLSCGKGEPGQAMYLGHGCSPARFRKVKVGIFKR